MVAERKPGLKGVFARRRFIAGVGAVAAITGLKPRIFASGRKCKSVTITVHPHLRNGVWPVDQSFNHFWTDGPNEANRAGQYSRWETYNPKLPRLGIHDYTSGGMPRLSGVWNFAQLDTMVQRDRLASSTAPMMTLGELPSDMLPYVATQTKRDEIAAFFARIVSYYNTGSMQAEGGATITNPNGVANKITYWEILNEPSNVDAHVNVDAFEYALIFKTCAAAMKAVDPTIKVVGPIDHEYGSASGNYISAALGTANPPDVVSFHNYGGPNSASDKTLLDTLTSSGEITMILAANRQAAKTKPIQITEHNLSWESANDPQGRPWAPVGQVWNADFFRLAGEYGVELIHQWNWSQVQQYGMVDLYTGAPELAYWRALYLHQYFPPGSTWLNTETSAPGEVEALAVKKPDGTISVLVINKKDNGAAVNGGPGVAQTVNVVMSGFSTTAATRRQIDSATDKRTGPDNVAVSTSSPSVAFPGYGISLFSLTGTVTETVQNFPKQESFGNPLAFGNANTAVIDAPPGVQSGDVVCVLLVTLDTDDPVTPATNFTQKIVFDSSATGSENYRTYVFWKRSAGDGTEDDTDTYLFSWATPSNRYGYSFRISGAAISGDPFDGPGVGAAGSGSTDAPEVSLTTTGPARLLLYFGSAWNGGPWLPPIGFTRILDRIPSRCYEYGSYSVKRQGVAGPTGTVISRTPSQSSGTKVVILLAVKPA